MFDWNDLRHFLAVARNGSTIAASKALGVSQSTVHRRLAELEKCIAHPLVARHATGYRLTEFGEELQPFVLRVEEAVEALERRLVASNETLTGSVRVTCSESIGYRLTKSPVLDTFHKLYPGLRVELLMSDQVFELSKGAADIAIRAGALDDDSLVGRKIADVAWGVYASQSYIELYGRPNDIDEINKHAVIGFEGNIRDHHAGQWLRTVAPQANVAARSDSVTGLIMTVKSGAGLAPLPIPLANAEPEIELVFGPLPGLVSQIYLLTHPDLRHTPRVSAFFDYIIHNIEKIRPVLIGTRP